MLCRKTHPHRAGRFAIVPGLVAFLGLSPAAWGDELRVVRVEPAPRTLNAPRDAAIVVDFDRPVRRNSVVTRHPFWAFGQWSGAVEGRIRFSRGRRRMTLVPDRVFAAGELVTVYLARHVRAVDGSLLRPGGYTFQFRAQARSAGLRFTEVERLATRLPFETEGRSYGGIASDLNGDRYLDLTIVNEDAHDLRVFLNRADGSGTFNDFLRPTFAAGQFPSPSEPADFNRDGFVDIAVAGYTGVAILLGRGDGTFAPQQLVDVGGHSRGLAVLDADGDGDLDLVATSHLSGHLALLANDGRGFFGAPAFFEGSGPGEYALATADMNEDGLLDLVVGDRLAQSLVVHAGNGDGTFTRISARGTGGEVWMVVPGDVDGDGHEDVAAVNSASDTSAVLLGDGTGRLGPPRLYPTAAFPLATDLGDLDGDGDLDWVVSRFFGGWSLYENDGEGRFRLARTFPARQAGSCALLLDVDNDRDLDLALIDELEDEVIVLHNVPDG